MPPCRTGQWSPASLMARRSVEARAGLVWGILCQGISGAQRIFSCFIGFFVRSQSRFFVPMRLLLTAGARRSRQGWPWRQPFGMLSQGHLGGVSASLATIRLPQPSPNSTLPSSVQQRQPCQLHDCSSPRQLVTVLPIPPLIHRREEIFMAPQDYLCARPGRFRPPKLPSFLRHCRPSHSRCDVITLSAH